MGKNHRHQKKLKAEKAKTKLKAVKTKFLPKGLNVTDTNFKVKPIVVREQLVQHTGHVTSRHLDLRDILNRLRHHNVMVKLDNLQQMREYIGTVGECQLSVDIPDVLEAVCPLYVSVEQRVRRGAARLTDDLLALISERNAEPHFDRIVSHLCCGMTHIAEGIREDSLLVFDALLGRAPRLLATRCDKVVGNFVSLVARARADANDASALWTDVKRTRTGVQWRLAVLRRFERLLQVVLDRKSTAGMGGISKPVETVKVASRVTCVPMFYDHRLRNTVDIFGKDVNVDAWLDACVGDVLPLLKDVWIEVRPKSRHTIKSAELNCTVINEETANVLSCIVNIVSCFHELMVAKCKEEKEENVVNEAFARSTREIVLLLLETFPYLGDNHRGTRNADAKCLPENLTVCYLFFVFFERVYRRDAVEQTLAYLNVCLSDRTHVGPDQLPGLLRVLKQFYERNVTSWRRHKDTNLAPFITNTAKYFVYNSKHFRSEIFCLLCGQLDATEEHFSLVVRKACRLLARSSRIERATFAMIRSLVLRGTGVAQDALSSLLPDVLRNAGTIEVEGIADSDLKVNSILGLYRYVPLNEDNVDRLLEFARLHPSFEETVQSIMEMKR